MTPENLTLRMFCLQQYLGAKVIMWKDLAFSTLANARNISIFSLGHGRDGNLGRKRAILQSLVLYFMHIPNPPFSLNWVGVSISERGGRIKNIFTG